jgi:uncharacterized protein (TIGR03083 family)
MADSAPPPILTAHLFPELDGCLLDLLESLGPDDWSRRTVVPAWNVQQIAAHLLDTASRRLSFGRDGAVRAPAPAITSDRDVAPFVNTLNARGVETYGALSPQVLVAFMHVVVRDLHAYLATLDPFATAAFGVSWAGERRSLNWFDVAREFTERWHHQQQIRLAVARPGILTRRLYHPVLDCFLRGLPYAFRSIAAPIGSIVTVEVSGDCGGVWSLRRNGHEWALTADPDPAAGVARVTIPQEIAWQIFTKAMPFEHARPQVTIAGDERLGAGVLGLVAIVA